MFLLIDKPKGITSHDVVNKVRRITGEKKVGHAGTLDPNATGLLIVGIGRESTKKLSYLADGDKVYLAEIFFGEERDTGDIEGKIIEKKEVEKPPQKKKIEETLELFKGEIKQVPPLYSAIKVKGKKAYELAREGKSVKLKSRKVTIHWIKLIKYEYPILQIRLKVSKGTYIRSIARDLGRKLGMGAYLKNLKRESINKFNLKDAVRLEDLTKENFKNYLIKA